MTCPNYAAGYCPAHDFDHVLERREAGLGSWVAAAPTVARATREQVRGMTVEASDLGIRAGTSWPDAIIVPDRDGHPVSFRRAGDTRDGEGELTAVLYTAGSHTLTVWND